MTDPATYSGLAAGATVQVTELDFSYAAKSASNLIVLQAQIHLTVDVSNRSVGGFLTAGGNAVSDGVTTYLANSSGNRIRTNALGFNTNTDTSITNLYMAGVHAPGSTSAVTYGLKVSNPDITTRRIDINRTFNHNDTREYGVGISSIFLWEVAA